MTQIQDLEKRVRDLYGKRDPEATDWSSWLFCNHVFAVADYAEKLAKRFGAREDLARAAGMLHDVADAVGQQRGTAHEQKSLEIARDLMQQCGFSKEAVAVVADDAIRWHSCHGDDRPKSLEGKILATADSMAHLQTEFYVFATWKFGEQKRAYAEIKAYVLEKIDRDLNVKIMFDEVREECRPDYEHLKVLFSR